MEVVLADLFSSIQNKIDHITMNEFVLSQENQTQLSAKAQQIIEDHLQEVSSPTADRVRAEYMSWGPLSILMQDESITEIIANGPYSIWYEKGGKLFQHPDRFWSEVTFRNVLERICLKAQLQITVENPCADGSFEDFRLSLVGHELTKRGVHLSLRRHPKNPWTFEKLCSTGWCQPQEISIFQNILHERKNFLIIGSTGSGKTSVLNSFLGLLPANERVLAIEDTSEIVLPNSSCMKLLTREDANGLLPPVDQTQLVKRALRLRPDRIAMGEVRGGEAKDFLMALATGHTGSFGTLHARDAHQALIRLEMLIQMGAPQWSLQAVRRLIQLSLDYVLVTEKNTSGERRFKGAYRLSSLEEQGFLLEKVETH
jgi:pilus assembly protein CpaF